MLRFFFVKTIVKSLSELQKSRIHLDMVRSASYSKIASYTRTKKEGIL